MNSHTRNEKMDMMLKRTAVTVVSVWPIESAYILYGFGGEYVWGALVDYERGDKWTKKKCFYFREKPRKSTHTKMKNSKSKRTASERKEKGKTTSSIWVKVKWMWCPFDVCVCVYCIYNDVLWLCWKKCGWTLKMCESNERKRDNATQAFLFTLRCVFDGFVWKW